MPHHPKVASREEVQVLSHMLDSINKGTPLGTPKEYGPEKKRAPRGTSTLIWRNLFAYSVRTIPGSMSCSMFFSS